MSEIAIVVSKHVRAAVVDNSRSFALEKLGRLGNLRTLMRVDSSRTDKRASSDQPIAGGKLTSH
jgi:hypothetical protein